MEEPNETHEITPAPEPEATQDANQSPAQTVAIPATSNKPLAPIRGIHGQPLK